MKRIHRSVLQVIAWSILSICVGASSARSCDVPDQAGRWKVGHTAFVAIDAARADRELPLDVWYPVDDSDWSGTLTFYSLAGPIGLTSAAALEDVAVSQAGPRPLIVFSHGFGGINLQSVRLMEHLASHGFVVVSPSHTGNTQLDQSSPDPEADRYPDIAFVIDEMERHNTEPGDAFLGRIDTQNVGVAGHSYGGMTAMFMAAGHVPFGPDPRVKAIMPVAGSSYQLTDAELTGITVPTMLMVGTLDSLQSDTARAFDLIQSAPFLYRADVLGANHTHFANVCDIGNALIDFGIAKENWAAVGAGALIPIYEDTCIPPAFPIEEATRLQNLYAAAHFRRHLLDETYYDRYLTGAYAAARESDVAYFGGSSATPDNFLCYKASASKGTPKFERQSIALSDAFESVAVDALKARAVCAPADKDLGGVVDACTHLTSYQIKAPPHSRQTGISVTDDFGTLSLDTIKPDRFLTPAAYALGETASAVGDSVDHFTCYKVKVTKGTAKLAKGTQAAVVDSFEDRIYDLKKPSRLCLPTVKDGQSVVEPAGRLLCYKAKRANGQAAHTALSGSLNSNDAFGPQLLDTKVEEELCVPATVNP